MTSWPVAVANWAGHHLAGGDGSPIARARDGEHEHIRRVEAGLVETTHEHSRESLIWSERTGEDGGVLGVGAHRSTEVDVHVIARRQQQGDDDHGASRGDLRERRLDVGLLHVDKPQPGRAVPGVGRRPPS